jgi:hypothetical protein
MCDMESRPESTGPPPGAHAEFLGNWDMPLRHDLSKICKQKERNVKSVKLPVAIMDEAASAPAA